MLFFGMMINVEIIDDGREKEGEKLEKCIRQHSYQQYWASTNIVGML